MVSPRQAVLLTIPPSFFGGMVTGYFLKCNTAVSSHLLMIAGLTCIGFTVLVALLISMPAFAPPRNSFTTLAGRVEGAANDEELLTL